MADPERSPDASPTGGDAVVGALEALGVEVLFGIPSVHNLPIYDALSRRGSVRAVTVRHEQAAAGAADGYARVSGRLGVLLTSTGPGAANAMGGLLEAYVSGSPVLHLTGQIESACLGKGRGFIHEVPEQPAMLGSLSKSVLRATSPGEIGRLVEEAGQRALAMPQGPVSLELPIDFQYAEVDSEPAARPREDEAIGSKSDERYLEAAAMVASARRPVIWAGGGVVASGAAGLLAALAHRIGAGVITTPNARGVLSEDDPLAIGNLSWDKEVRELVRDADLLIGIGTRYQGPNTENWKMALSPRILQIDVDPERPKRNYEATLAVKGDAGEVLAAVLAHLDASSPTGPEEGWRERVTTTAAAARQHLRQTIGPQADLLDEIEAAIGAETVVVKDSTIPAYTWGNRLLKVSGTRRSVMPNGFAIGLGLPHALGAAAAAGEPVILMVGDGGFMLSATELATAAAERLAVVVVLFNDGGYGILRNIQESQYGRRIGVDLGSPDFCALARSLGVEAERVETPADFGKALRRALAAKEPYLIEVDLATIGPMTRPYTGTSKPSVTRRPA